MVKAFVSGCAGTTLSSDEIAFFRDENPWGLILFARNVETPEQVSALTAAFRETVGRKDAPVLVDQEGGRVQRLKPPNWPKYPAAKCYGDLFETDPDKGLRAARLGGQLIALDLSEIGINLDCVPCLDIRFPETVDAIGDRAFSSDPSAVTRLGQAMIEGAFAGGILPVIKHIPGHGRATVDSHHHLPRVSADRQSLDTADFVPFKALSNMPFGMTAHLLFEDLDNNAPGTQSRYVIEEIIRGEIGFEGCLMSDDISMKALGGEIGSRSAKTLEAGCDLVLHCNGDMAEMRAVADAVPKLSGLSLKRCEQGLAQLQAADRSISKQDLWDEFCQLTGGPGV